MYAQIWRLRPGVRHIAVTQVSTQVDRAVIEKIHSQNAVLTAQIFGLGNCAARSRTWTFLRGQILRRGSWRKKATEKAEKHQRSEQDHLQSAAVQPFQDYEEFRQEVPTVPAEERCF